MIKGGVGYYRNQNIYGKQKNEEAHLLGINRTILNQGELWLRIMRLHQIQTH